MNCPRDIALQVLLVSSVRTLISPSMIRCHFLMVLFWLSKRYQQYRGWLLYAYQQRFLAGVLYKGWVIRSHARLDANLYSDVPLRSRMFQANSTAVMQPRVRSICFPGRTVPESRRATYFQKLPSQILFNNAAQFVNATVDDRLCFRYLAIPWGMWIEQRWIPQIDNVISTD